MSKKLKAKILSGLRPINDQSDVPVRMVHIYPEIHARLKAIAARHNFKLQVMVNQILLRAMDDYTEDDTDENS